jgi:hypothetical protein
MGQVDDTELWAGPTLKCFEVSQCQVGLKVPLVKFVEDHRGNALQARVLKQPSHEDSFGEKSQSRGVTAHFFKTKMVADRLTRFFIFLLGHAVGGIFSR